jgi:hypothetical protein
MLSLIILVVAGAYVGLWYLLIRALPNRWAKAVVALVAVYLPFWDVPYGYYNFRTLCAEEGGVKVFEKVAPQNSIYLDKTMFGAGSYMFKLGYQVVEEHDRAGHIVRRDASDPSRRETVDRASLVSTYGTRIEPTKRQPWGISRVDEFVFVLRTDSDVIRSTYFTWQIWINSLGVPGLGHLSFCPDRVNRTNAAAALRSGR